MRFWPRRNHADESAIVGLEMVVSERDDSVSITTDQLADFVKTRAERTLLKEHLEAAEGSVEILSGHLAATAEALVAAEQERDRILTYFYRLSPVEVARLCDEELDRRGALLGRIRMLSLEEDIRGCD